MTFFSFLDPAPEGITGDVGPTLPHTSRVAGVGTSKTVWPWSNVVLNGLLRGLLPVWGAGWGEASSQDCFGCLCGDGGTQPAAAFQKHLLKMQMEGKLGEGPPGSPRTSVNPSCWCERLDLQEARPASPGCLLTRGS